MPKPMNTWEEELRNIIENISYDESLSVDEKTEIIKAFIRAELQRQRKEIVEMIKGMKYKDVDFFGIKVHNKALDDIIKKIGEGNGK